MATTILGLIIMFLAALCGELYQQNQREKQRNDRIEDQLRSLNSTVATLIAVKETPITAKDILEKKKTRPFTPHISWREEQARLEAKHDRKRIAHEKLVAEIEKGVDQ